MSVALESRIAALLNGPLKGQGWCSVDKAHDLARAILKLRSSVTVEIGVFFGRSLLPMAMAHAEQAHGTVWAIDPWSPEAAKEGYDGVNAAWWGGLNHDKIYQTFLAHIAAQGLDKYVNVVRQKSDDVTPPDAIDFLHLDGQHTDQTSRDVDRFASRVRPGGMVFVDDIHWSGGGVERAVEKLVGMGFIHTLTRDTGGLFSRPLPSAPVIVAAEPALVTEPVPAPIVEPVASVAVPPEAARPERKPVKKKAKRAHS